MKGGITSFLSVTMAGASPNKRIPLGDLIMDSSPDEHISPSKKASPIDSIWGKENISKEKFEMGVINFRMINLRESPQDIIKDIQDWYKKQGLTLTPQEAESLANKAYHEETVALKDAKVGKFSIHGDYAGIREGRSKGVRKKIRKNNISLFLNELNKLYKGTQNRWAKMYGIVNGTPDTAYFIPVQTTIIYNNLTALPLGFSYDSVTKSMRIIYIPTGDPMFSYIYSDPINAIKARQVHLKMLNWSLPPEDLALMYKQWYGSPLKYNRVFQLLHKQLFGQPPPYFIKVSGIFDAEKFYPDWRDQRSLRNTLLTSLGGLGGIKDNSEWTDEIQQSFIDGQASNYLSDSLKGTTPYRYKEMDADSNRLIEKHYPGGSDKASPFSMENVSVAKKSKRGQPFKKPTWLTKMEQNLTIK
jgi:hypothetical protein